MKSLTQRIAETNDLLAPYAVPIRGTLGRIGVEPEDETRFPFQRDRDRVIHSQAFRRLQGKTQVFVAGEGDHFRTRLTHTMEVAQLSRDIARTLGLNEDLAECIALAHDLGHPPFAHMGEEALDAWMHAHGSHFEHNEQSLRIVTLLEEHSPRSGGLNLQREVLDGLNKHRQREKTTERGPSLEAQVVDLADEIAYSAHDCDDGLRAGLFTAKDLSDMSLIASAQSAAFARGTSLRGAVIHLLVSDLYATTQSALGQTTIRTLDDVYAAAVPLVAFSAEMRRAIDALHEFLHKRMYAHPRVREANRYGQDVIRTLCEHYENRPSPKITELQKRTGGTLPESVKDYVAGMTDAFARAQAEISAPGSKKG